MQLVNALDISHCILNCCIQITIVLLQKSFLDIVFQCTQILVYSVTKCKAKFNNLSHIYLNPALLQSEIFVNCYCDIKQKCIYLISIIKLLIVHTELHYDKCIFVFHCFNKCIWFIPRGGMFCNILGYRIPSQPPLYYQNYIFHATTFLQYYFRRIIIALHINFFYHVFSLV